MSLFEKLKSGLGKTTAKFSEGISAALTHKKLDEEILGNLEELLITSDISAKTAGGIIEKLRQRKFGKEISAEEIKKELAEIIAEILSPAEKSLTIGSKPHVILMVGVNGNGKTTTIGKLALRFRNEGKKVMLAACDTFRAAATSQLEVWAEKAGCTLIKGAENSDPASVAFTALAKAREENADILLVDTAGRLQNKQGLMEELSKIRRVLNNPDNTILVIDATTGQNAISQAESFIKTALVNGLIITKLDGTAKAGAVIEITESFKLPIHFMGVGEKPEDLIEFSSGNFAQGLVGI